MRKIRRYLDASVKEEPGGVKGDITTHEHSTAVVLRPPARLARWREKGHRTESLRRPRLSFEKRLFADLKVNLVFLLHDAAEASEREDSVKPKHTVFCGAFAGSVGFFFFFFF